ncbi:MAG: galactofuranose ABC transporter, permease protein YjfF [bacterium]
MNLKLSRQNFPFFATVIVCLLLYLAAGLAFRGFFSPLVLINILSDNAFLGITAVGLTFVILSGGIDLSVGAVIGCTSILIASMTQLLHLDPLATMAIVLALGTLFGLGMGCLIHFFDLPPFLVTLAGLFLCRGLGLVISTESIAISSPLYVKLSGLGLPLGHCLTLPLPAIIFMIVLAAGIFVSRLTPFGRHVYALGGHEPSARLMGLPIGRTKIGVYALSGFCSALAGVVYTIYTQSGNAIAATALELDAIAAVVVGGTLLSGGVGNVAGTLVGVLIFGIIQTAITFQGSLSSWWTKIAVGVLLLVFILLQRLIQRKRK